MFLKKRTLNFESLESRRQWAVVTSLSGSTLTITGDLANDHIAVVESGGQLTVIGDTATVVVGDGLAAPASADTFPGGGRTFTSGQFRTILISLGDGDDTVEFAGLVAADIDSLAVDLGNATNVDTVQFSDHTFIGDPDTIYGPNSVGGPLTITSGSGNDVATLSQLTAAGTVRLDTGLGNDSLTIGNFSTGGSLLIDTGDSVTGDILAIGSATATVSATGGMVIHSGSGNDRVSLNNISATDRITLETGAGGTFYTEGHNEIAVGNLAPVTVANRFALGLGVARNEVAIDGLSTGSLTIAGNTFFDQIKLGKTSAIKVAGAVVIDLKEDSDYVDMTNLSCQTLTIDMGTGSSHVILGGNSSPQFITVTGLLSLRGNAQTVGDDVPLLNQFQLVKVKAGAVDIATGVGRGIVVMKSLAIKLGMTIDLTSATRAGTIRLESSTIGGNVSMRTGIGDDEINIRDAHFARGLAIATGAGESVIEIKAGTTIGTALSIRVGQSASKVSSVTTLSGVTVGTFTFQGAAGRDVLEINAGQVDRLFANFGAGSDSLIANENNIRLGGKVDGGPGFDRARLVKSTPRKLKLVRFE